MFSPNVHPLWLVFLAAGFAALPLVIGLFTAYVKLSVVLGLLKSALGTQQAPSGLVVMALSVSLTLFTMAPVIEACGRALDPVKIDAIMKAPSIRGIAELGPAFKPLRSFLQQHAGSRELRVLSDLASPSTHESIEQPPEGPVVPSEVDQVPLKVLLPAFVLTELKEAFAMGFVLLLPFLVIDLIVANVLVGMGMMMVSPVMVSLPLKLVLFVVADGWLLLAKGLLQSYA